MKIAINAPISANTAGGVESNILSLIKQMAKTNSDISYEILCIGRHIHEIIPFLGQNQHANVWPYVQRGSVPDTKMNGRWGRLRRSFPRAGVMVDFVYHMYTNVFRLPTEKKADEFLKSRGVSAIHFPNPLFFGTSVPFLYEPWDLQHRHFPEFFSKEEFAWRERTYYEGCRRAKLVVTATHWTKQDIMKQFGIEPSKIAVIPRGSLMCQDRMPIRKRSDFAFYPAMTFPSKNHIRLLQALARLRDEKGVVLPLICTGRFYKPHMPKVMEEVKLRRLEGQVLFLGQVSDKMLCLLFSIARFMVFPSLFEGLGIPLIEAAHHGLPILASNSTSIPEVIGDAALLFDGHSVDSICDALFQAIQNPDLLNKRIAEYPTLLDKYSWERAAKNFNACYKFVAGQALSSEEQGLLDRAVGVT